jgi:two-component sensor histidine kinase
MRRFFFVSGLLLWITANGYAGRHAPDPAAGPAADTARFGALMRRAFPFFQTNLDSAGFYYKAARALAEADHDPREIAEAGNGLGNWYRETGDHTTAMSYYKESGRIFDSLKDWSGEGLSAMNTAQLYKNIASINSTRTLIDEGIQMAITSYGLFLRAHDTARMINALNEEGILYRDKAKSGTDRSYYDTAYARYLEAVGLITLSGKARSMTARLYNNISQIFREYKKDPHAALSYLAKAEAINIAAHSRWSLTFNYNNFALAYIDLGKTDSALYYTRKMLAIATELKTPDRRYDAYNQLYICFDGAKRSDSALHYYILASELKDSLTNLAKTKEVLNLQEKYNSVKKEMDISKLNAENTSKNKTITLLVISLMFLGVLVAAFSYLIARLRMQKRQIAEQRLKLEVMLRELHHRVKNNLQIVSSLLGLQRYRSEDAETISVLQESQHRVQAMSLIHQRLYRNEALSTVNIREYLVDLCESLLSSYGYHRDRFDLAIDVCTEVMDVDHALPMGLIVNELVTNAFKYAYPGVGRPSLRISLEQDSRNMVLTVSDNGVGMDQERWQQGKESFGKQLIGALCKQLRATQEIAAREGTVAPSGDGAGAGTVITIRIPREAAA